MTGTRVLLVEDDPHVLAALRTVLTQHGFGVLQARTAAEGLRALAGDPDVVLLDLGLPDSDGLVLCGRIRQRSSVPVIMVTARSQPEDRVRGLHYGADDYLVKPYHMAELLARIHAVTRRARPATPPSGEVGRHPHDQPAGRRVGPLSIDPVTRTVAVHGRPVSLTRKEFDLVWLLARHPGVVYRREHILGEVWNLPPDGGTHTLEVHVSTVRRKLGDHGLVQTVHGVGYRLGVTAPSGH